jgi:formamidopyrimidine-DNA glycosylase
LGVSGSFKLFGSELLWCIYITGPEPREATRLQLENKKEGLVAHLSATLCVHGDLELYRSRIAKLGPDPLRQDADKEVVWLSMQKTKQSIGAFLMDQSMIAGIGNIYRSELLLVTGIHPDHCASTVSRSSFESLWIQAKQLMEIGVQTGYIITILTDDTGMFSMALLIAFYLQVCYQ